MYSSIESDSSASTSNSTHLLQLAQLLQPKLALTNIFFETDTAAGEQGRLMLVADHAEWSKDVLEAYQLKFSKNINYECYVYYINTDNLPAFLLQKLTTADNEIAIRTLITYIIEAEFTKFLHAIYPELSKCKISLKQGLIWFDDESGDRKIFDLKQLGNFWPKVSLVPCLLLTAIKQILAWERTMPVRPYQKPSCTCCKKRTSLRAAASVTQTAVITSSQASEDQSSSAASTSSCLSTMFSRRPKPNNQQSSSFASSSSCLSSIFSHKPNLTETSRLNSSAATSYGTRKVKFEIELEPRNSRM